MTKEELCLRQLGAWECIQNTPHHIYSVGKHTEKVVQYCIEHGASEELTKAAWLHDAGKMSAKTSDKEGCDHFPDHPAISAKIAEELGESEYVINLIYYHDAHRDKDVPYEKLASKGRKWCNELGILMMGDLAAQNPTFNIEEKLKDRQTFLKKLKDKVDEIE